MTITTGAISSIVSLVGETVSGAIEWMGDIVNFVTSTPLVFLFVTLGLVGLGISMLRRLIG